MPDPTCTLLATPTPPANVTAPLVDPVESEVEENVADPLTSTELRVPTLVTFGCEAVCKVPVKLDAERELMPLIDPLLFKTTAFELVAVPATAPDKNAASDPIVDPAIVTELKEPTEVMFGWAAVCKVPLTEVAAIELIPLTDPELFNTTALEFAAAPATAPDRKAASDPIVEPAIDTELKAPTDVMLG